MKKIRVGTVFSGIGAFEQALLKLNIEHEIVFACDTGERYIDVDVEKIKKETLSMSPKQKKKYIDDLYEQSKKPNYVKKAYFANYKISEDRRFNDIRFLSKKDLLDDVDVLVGGSPCQSFSAIGKRGGLEDARGTLFYDYARLISETKPKVFIFENVPGMLTHDQGKTRETINRVFESLGYKIYYDILNAKDYGIPQDRKRLFVVGFQNNKTKFLFPKKKELNSTVFDYLEERVEVKHYLGKKGFEFVTSRKYRGRARVNQTIIRTQKANQQFNRNGDFIFEPLDLNKHKQEILNRAYVGEREGIKGVCRQLSYRECMRLMGFPDTYKIVVPNVQAYRQAGNSIVVNVLEELIKEILKSGVFDE